MLVIRRTGPGQLEKQEFAGLSPITGHREDFDHRALLGSSLSSTLVNIKLKFSTMISPGPLSKLSKAVI